MLVDGKPVLEFVSVQRKDTNEWAIPGVMFFSFYLFFSIEELRNTIPCILGYFLIIICILLLL